MNIIDKLIEWINPEQALQREVHRKTLKEYRNYDASKSDRLSGNWNPMSGTAEQTDMPYRRKILFRARDLERNNDIAKSVISAFERNVVGRGYNLQARVKDLSGDEDEDLNTLIEKKWKKWCKSKNCDISNQASFKEMLRMIIRRNIVDGDFFILKKYDYSLAMPLQLQLLESDQLDTTREFGDSGNRVKSGIEVDDYNKPLAYWFFKDLADNYYFSYESIRIPAKDVIHMYPRHRPTQVRGVSPLASSMGAIRDAGEYLEAERVKARIAACFAIFVKSSINSMPGGRMNSLQSVNSQKIDTIEPGMFEYLAPGEEIVVADPGKIPTNTKEFVQQQQRLVGSGQGISYEQISRDVSQVSYSSARQGMLEDRRTYEPLQDWLIEHFCNEIYESWLETVVLSGELPIKNFWQDKDRYFDHTFIPPGWTWIDPLRDATASEKELANNIATLEEICAEQGKDWRDVAKQRAREIKYLKENNLIIEEVPKIAEAEKT